jgi:hypothetical protein
VNLAPGAWSRLVLDTRGQPWPEPFRTLGVHFTASGYTGPVYIDTVNIDP